MRPSANAIWGKCGYPHLKKVEIFELKRQNSTSFAASPQSFLSFFYGSRGFASCRGVGAEALACWTHKSKTFSFALPTPLGV
jgi:hypothetical protein